MQTDIFCEKKVLKTLTNSMKCDDNLRPNRYDEQCIATERLQMEIKSSNIPNQLVLKMTNSVNELWLETNFISFLRVNVWINNNNRI